jgi:diaminopimelate decarboxylase
MANEDYKTAVRTLVTRCFGNQDSEFAIGGTKASALAERHGTPLFIYDRRILDRSLDNLRAALPARFQVFYSVKANPNDSILRHFVSRDCGLEVASAGELARAHAAGCASDRIIFAGPAKTYEELNLALSENIAEIHVESFAECERIAAICNRHGYHARVAVRINPSEDVQGGAMRMGGTSTPFGVDEELIDSLLEFLMSTSKLDLQGLHTYVGTQILDFRVILDQYQRAIQLARRLAAKTGKPVRTLDFGGGLGIPYFLHEAPLDLHGLRRGLATLMETVCSEPAFRETQFLVEPGRFLVGEAGVFITRVVDVKTSRGKKYAILDGGMNHHLAASGNLGQTIKRNFPIAVLNKLDEPECEAVDFAGPLCTPLDTLGRAVPVPRVEIDDLVGIFQSGAYALTASPVGFLSHPLPAEILVDDGVELLIRARGGYAENPF